MTKPRKSTKKAVKRDYKAEYKRRIYRGKVLGLSRAVAAGHPKKGTAGIKAAKFLRIKPGAALPHLVAPSFPSKQTLKEKGFVDFIEMKRAQYLKNKPRTLVQQLVTSKEDFVQALIEAGHSEHEAYSAWFSP